ncbi:unnamed protein product [Prunus armeniaca]|uniref:Uncharacterized protein n=1 Tax=Prunus armeniaca TaxID=36596 RepID=A0A6J5TK86_PRUAR|nr:unnamed protein product [Prunus armeniaca]
MATVKLSELLENSSSTLFSIHEPKRSISKRAQDVRLTSQLSALIGLQHTLNISNNRVEAVDPDLRRCFDEEIEVTAPTKEERFQILKLYTRKLPLNSNVNLQALALCCEVELGLHIKGTQMQIKKLVCLA